MPKLRHFDNLGTARFITFSCHNQLPLLEPDSAKETFLRELDSSRTKHEFKILAYVIMPQHVHLLIDPVNEMELGRVIGEIKSRSAREIVAKLRRNDVTVLENLRTQKGGEERISFWKPRCYDHNCRSNDTIIEKTTYCHNNPVKRGLVSSPDEWRWSSYGAYIGESDFAVQIDHFESLARF
ncbi:MAG: transposase [candidate division Zixibacteria bacterium]|nr:transposase [candidate division Zixibacteria bacterium]